MDFRQRLEQSRSKPVSNDEPFEQDDHFSCTYFATARSGTPACLDLRLPDGSRNAVPYAYFVGINYDADKGIEILTAHKRIQITGRNLLMLYDYLVAYRLRFVQANIGNDTCDDGIFIKAILVERID